MSRSNEKEAAPGGLTGIDGTVAVRLVVFGPDLGEPSSTLADFQELFAGVAELPDTTIEDLKGASQPLIAWLQEDPANVATFLEDPIHALTSVDSIRSRIGQTTREALEADTTEEHLSAQAAEATTQTFLEAHVGTSPSQTPRDAVASWVTDNEDHLAKFLKTPEETLREAFAAAGVVLREIAEDGS